VLWIKGKPGTGKSTLVKHTLRHCEQNFKDHIVAAYFCKARGGNLEKTPLGMLRSLSYQLHQQESSLYERFVPKFRDKLQTHKAGEWEWR
jgi:Cdc6-like AAA superfamily ATPase